MILRSLLFVPADRPDRFDKALNSSADAIILDMEDSVVPSRKEEARIAVASFLEKTSPKPIFVRINPLTTQWAAKDVSALIISPPDGIILPKAEGAKSIRSLLKLLNGNVIPTIPIATETAASVFELGTYRDVAEHLIGLTWGAEDMPASIGASTSRHEDGSYTPPYEMLRSVSLFAAHAADAAAIDTVYVDIKNLDGLAAYAARSRRDGFTGMLAIHPSQTDIINAAFTPTAEEIQHANMIVDAFSNDPEAGALQINGKMVDAPHLIQAQKLLARFAPTN
ncbi:HpcH/HpaI aldolase/citrate lyase family protein [Hirschia litorea]|uniref:HpcH/HpaI aldolase/citrate lyase family protein n=1 Tax=Hirschia litorea TaxID=1199156 RepID=A0ABW2IIC2_9PROT